MSEPSREEVLRQLLAWSRSEVVVKDHPAQASLEAHVQALLEGPQGDSSITLLIGNSGSGRRTGMKRVAEKLGGAVRHVMRPLSFWQSIENLIPTSLMRHVADSLRPTEEVLSTPATVSPEGRLSEHVEAAGGRLVVLIDATGTSRSAGLHRNVMEHGLEMMQPGLHWVLSCPPSSLLYLNDFMLASPAFHALLWPNFDDRQAMWALLEGAETGLEHLPPEARARALFYSGGNLAQLTAVAEGMVEARSIVSLEKGLNTAIRGLAAVSRIGHTLGNVVRLSPVHPGARPAKISLNGDLPELEHLLERNLALIYSDPAPTIRLNPFVHGKLP